MSTKRISLIESLRHYTVIRNSIEDPTDIDTNINVAAVYVNEVERVQLYESANIVQVISIPSVKVG